MGPKDEQTERYLQGVHERLEQIRTEADAQARNMRAVADELPDLAAAKLAELREEVTTEEEFEERAPRALLDVLRDLENDPERSPEFREAARVQAKEYQKLLATKKASGD